MLTQKDLYDFLEKNGVEKYDAMVKDLAANINSAKDKFLADQEKKDQEKKLVDYRVGQLSGLLKDWFPADKFNLVTPDEMAKSFYKVVDEFDKVQADALKHAKNVKTETKEIPGGTETVTKAEISDEDFNKVVHDVLDAFKYAFNW